MAFSSFGRTLDSDSRSDRFEPYNASTLGISLKVRAVDLEFMSISSNLISPVIYGGFSSVGRTSDCDSECHEFKSRRSPLT